MKFLTVALLVLVAATPASAQLTGHISLIVDAFPDLDGEPARQSVTELRARIFAERHDDIGRHLRIHLAGYVDALLANRTNTGGRATTSDAIVRPADLYVELAAARIELRAGASRIVWGRLDEFQPTDVVNPIDLSRFIMEGRSEARLPVGLVRARMFLPTSTTIEAVVVPAFRRGRFDQLAEPSSPFDLAASVLPRIREEPAFGAGTVQGGLRLSSTTRRVDWTLTAFRGLKSFPTVSIRPTPDTQGFFVVETFPRFTMVGGDFETVHGPWGLRGEVAAFVEDELQSAGSLRGVPGHSVNAGVGVDRRAGDYRIAANALWQWSGVDKDDSAARRFIGDDDVERADLSLVIAADRSFARETRTVRVFAVYDPADATTFARVIGAVSVRDNLWIEGSAGLFIGDALDIIGRLTRRDFVYARLKVFF